MGRQPRSARCRHPIYRKLGVSICAVVPTYNRRDQVLRCIDALASQVHPLDEILVVDNGSSDGTSGVLASDERVTLVRTEINDGSAGGFGRGISWAYDHGHEWIWLIDNDSYADPSALSELLSARARFGRAGAPTLLASKVTWTDGSILPLNAPMFRRRELETFYRAAEASTLSIRMAPYAGVLLHRSLVELHGVPIAEYFLWNDDVEYTGRVLRDGFGVLVPTSVLVHEVPRKSTTTADAGSRYYFEIRNKLWMVRGSNAYDAMEKARFVLTLAVDTVRFLRRNRPVFAISVVGPGLWRGLLSPAPRPR